jgi:hypothetical protein
MCAIRYSNYADLLRAFAEFYKQYAMPVAQVTSINHMGYIVESHLLREMHSHGLIGDWDGPYPLIDISGCLLMVGEDPTSVDVYVRKYGLHVPIKASAHNPLYDAMATAEVYKHLLGRIPPA